MIDFQGAVKTHAREMRVEENKSMMYLLLVHVTAACKHQGVLNNIIWPSESPTFER